MGGTPGSRGCWLSPGGPVHAKALVEGEQGRSGAQTNRCSNRCSDKRVTNLGDVLKCGWFFNGNKQTKKEYEVTWLQYSARLPRASFRWEAVKPITVLTLDPSLGILLTVRNLTAPREQRSISLRANSSSELQVELQLSFPSRATLCDTQGCICWTGSWNSHTVFLKCLCECLPFPCLLTYLCVPQHIENGPN